MNKSSPIVSGIAHDIRVSETHYVDNEPLTISFSRTKADPELRLNGIPVPASEVKIIMDRPDAINMMKALKWLYERKIQMLVDNNTLPDHQPPHIDEHFLSRLRTPVSRLVSQRYSQLNHFD